MTEQEFRSYYHMDDRNWEPRYGSKVVYRALRVWFINIIKQVPSAGKYTSQVAAWATTFQSIRHAISLNDRQYIVVPIKLYHPVTSSRQRYSLTVCEESRPLVNALQDCWASEISFRSEGKCDVLHFSLAKCMEYCDRQNRENDISHTTSIFMGYLYTLYENMFILQVAMKLDICQS